jgi:hypothetical protein
MKPNHPRALEEAWNHEQSGRRDQALAALRALLEAEPRCAEGWTDLGGLLLLQGRREEAEQCCARALREDRGCRTATLVLACSLMGSGHLDEAERLCRGALARDPGSLDALLALGKCLIKKGDLAQARTVLQRAGELGPGGRGLSRVLQALFAAQDDWAERRRDLERALPHYSSQQHDYEEASLCLLHGEFDRGWELYESRHGLPGSNSPVRHFSQPAWNGEAFPDRTLLLHWEQGLGDTLMFVRYASRVKRLGGRVLLLAQPSLADLVATCPGVDQVIVHLADLPSFDLQSPLLSLPRVFRTSLDSIPAEIPYLDVPGQVPNRQAIAAVLAAAHGRTRLGIAWAGSPTHTRDKQRSLPVDALAPLGALSGVAWYSFQKDQEPPASLPGVFPLAPLLGNFSDTAYALSGMDLVLAADTALAHLAGAMGIPTLLLLPYAPDFRWLLGRDDSPWYPSMRLFRQPRPEDWSAVIRMVLRKLGAS